MLSIGVPKEMKDGERRVALTGPAAARLVSQGFRVLVERGGGVGSGIEDAEFSRAGVVLCDVEEVWACDLVVKVKEPQPAEFRFFRPDLNLFAFLHLAAEPDLAAALCAAGVRAFAFEDVTAAARRPLLAPMSQVAGRVAGVVGPYLLSTAAGGRGVLAGAVDGARPARATIVGAGVAGTAAAASLSALGVEVFALDVNEGSLQRLSGAGFLAGSAAPGSFLADEYIVSSDILVGAALVPGRRAPVVVSAGQVERMRPGSVVVDIAIDQGGCVATSRPTSLADPTFTEYGVVHYCVPNMPGQFPATSTQALSTALVTYVGELAAALESGDPGDFYGAAAVSSGRILPR